MLQTIVLFDSLEIVHNLWNMKYQYLADEV